MTTLLRYLAITLLINCSLYGHAQVKQPVITGKLVDENKLFLSYVVVKLYKSSDSTLVATAQSDDKGLFSFTRQPAGPYYIQADMIGYQKTSIALTVTDVTDDALDLGTIVLPGMVQQLNAVSVGYKRPLIERRDGKVIVNVSSSTLAAGSNAMEILSRIPGVSVDNQGNISFRGKPGINVMIDGKLTYLSSSQMVNLLRSTDGNVIQNIEIISNPSAKYDAGGTGGIINIRLKKNTSEGTNGTLTLGGGIGKYHKSNGAISLNHRSGSLNLFGNYNYSNNKQFEDLELTRSSRAGTDITFFDQKAGQVSSRDNNNYKAGIDYFIDKNNTIGVMVNGYMNSYNGDNKIRTSIASRPKSIDSTVMGSNLFLGNYGSNTFNLNYKSVLDTSGQELNLDFDYSQVSNTEDATYQNDFLGANGAVYRLPVIFRNATPSKIGIWAGKIDYTLPFAHKMKLETGLKSSLVTTDNDFRSELKIDQHWINDPGQSNRFAYRENVNALYANLHKQIGSTTIQIGLRTEHTHSQARSITLGNRTVRNYIDLFPSLSVQHALSDDNTIDFSYSRRIDRPSYQSLNPFTYYSDLFTVSQGNPMLRPQYASSYEANFRHGKLNLTFGYIRTRDVMATTLLTDTLRKTIIFYEQNLAARRTISISLSRPLELTDWWSSTNDATLYNSGFSSPELMGSPFRNYRTTLELSTIHTFKLSPSVNSELSASYTSSQVYGTYVARAIYGLDLGISKSFAGERATVKLAATDLFDQRKISIRSAVSNQDYQLVQKQESRIFRVTFSYNFGSKMVKANRRRSNISTQEQERVKSGR